MPGFQIIAGGKRAGRAGCRNEGREPKSGTITLELGEHAVERPPGAVIMDEVIGKLGKLVEDDVVLLARELRALVADFLDVALGARRADDVGRIGDPACEPIEALAAHALGQHRDAAAAEDRREWLQARDPHYGQDPGRRAGPWQCPAWYGRAHPA